mmetsp:Transcript_1175/g.1426  ORF Transcript_1175/g.1426 Transcript_1175/m.1426 type:complete len:481 (-) Transcript_1175:260-1702(-)
MFANTDSHGAKASGTAVATNVFEEKKQPSKCRDPLFAFLFIANLCVMVGISIAYGSNPFKPVDNNNGQVDDLEAVDWSPVLWMSAVTGGCGFVLSMVFLSVLMAIPSFLIKFALIFNVVLTGAVAALGFYLGDMVLGVFGSIFFLLMVCYVYCIWSRIPFATANLKTGCAAVRANCGITFLAYIVTAVAFGWTILWTVVMVGVQDKLITCEQVNGVNQCTSPNYGLLFLLFLSYFFTHQVLSNIIHVSVAGTVGTWWFMPGESGFCGGAVLGSFFRTITTSLGSVCFGSLLVAIIEALKQIAYTARDNDDMGQCIYCLVQCLLSCLEGILEYFNKWAFVYVGLYGYGYCEAGKNVMQLFKDRGWEAIIADDIVGTVLGMLSLVVGLICAGIGLLVTDRTDWFDAINLYMNDNGTFVKFMAGIVGFVIGFALCLIVMGVIASSVNSTIVLFAEGPAEFEENHPELSREMREAYLKIHPGCI